jgi:hypothetical protein
MAESASASLWYLALGDGNGGEGLQREERVDSIPLECENAPVAGKKPLFWILFDFVQFVGPFWV